LKKNLRNRIIPYRKDLKDKARELRNNSTLAEILLWKEIKGRRFGFQFHRQVPLLDYIVDFYCHELMLAIEVDGISHTHEKAVLYDSHRQQRLEEEGVYFLRFDDLDVKKSMHFVLQSIEDWIENNKTNTPPAPLKGGDKEIYNLKSRNTQNINEAEPNYQTKKKFNKTYNLPPSGGIKGGVLKNTHFIKDLATKLGFSFCGISKAEFLAEEAPKLETWLKRNYQGKMSYLENHFDKRLDPTLLVPGARSVISLVYNYYPKKDLGTPENLKIAKYAYGEDYHFVVKDLLSKFLTEIQQHIGDVQGRAFVDSAPVMERAWAKKSGLGWIGKNSLLLNRSMGSFFFLAEVIVDLELNYDSPIKDYCGTCTACMDACPTEAIPQPYVVDGSKCISYFTIELKEEIPTEVKGKFENWIFGCDICQDVCPWNRFSTPHNEPRFSPHPELNQMTTSDWQEITDDVFQKIFKKSAVKRTKLEGLKRNIKFVREK
jgi:epoxyqueuosine reductase